MGTREEASVSDARLSLTPRAISISEHEILWDEPFDASWGVDVVDRGAAWISLELRQVRNGERSKLALGALVDATTLQSSWPRYDAGSPLVSAEDWPEILAAVRFYLAAHGRGLG